MARDSSAPWTAVPGAIVRILWASPNTALGLGVGAVAVMLGARAQLGRNAIEFLDNPFVGAIKRSGVTLGHTIHYAPGRNPTQGITRYDGRGQVRLGEHERAHTLQYERWGPLFLVAYAISWLPWVPPRGGSRFEHAADDWAEGRYGRG